MSQVLEFPSRERQGLAFLEQQVRELLAARGADEELMDYAASTVRDIYEKNVQAENYTVSLDLPEGLNPDQLGQLEEALAGAIEEVRDENHAVVVRLVAELALARVRLFQYER